MTMVLVYLDRESTGDTERGEPRVYSIPSNVEPGMAVRTQVLWGKLENP